MHRSGGGGATYPHISSLDELPAAPSYSQQPRVGSACPWPIPVPSPYSSVPLTVASGSQSPPWLGSAYLCPTPSQWGPRSALPHCPFPTPPSPTDLPVEHCSSSCRAGFLTACMLWLRTCRQHLMQHKYQNAKVNDLFVS